MSALALQGDMPKILEIEAFMKGLPQGEFPVTECRIDGVYARSMFIPAGSILTGKIHNGESISILAQGTIKICDGEKSFEISAPHTAISPAGIKRLGFAVTDCTFISIHPLERDKEPSTLVADTFEEFEQNTKLLEVL